MAPDKKSWRKMELPPMKGQILQGHPVSFGYMHLGELPDERLRHIPIPQELAVGQNHHTLLTPRKHHVRPPLVPHEPRPRRPDDRNHNVIFFVSLEGINVEHGVFPGEVRDLERVLDRVPLGVVGGDDFEVFAFADVTLGNQDCGFDFAFVLNGGRVLSLSRGPLPLGRICVPSN